MLGLPRSANSFAPHEPVTTCDWNHAMLAIDNFFGFEILKYCQINSKKQITDELLQSRLKILADYLGVDEYPAINGKTRLEVFNALEKLCFR